MSSFYEPNKKNIYTRQTIASASNNFFDLNGSPTKSQKSDTSSYPASPYGKHPPVYNSNHSIDNDSTNPVSDVYETEFGELDADSEFNQSYYSVGSKDENSAV